MPLVGGAHVPIVEVMVNGHGPYRFVVDTGAAQSVIARDLAHRLGLAVAPVEGGVTGAHGEVVAADGAATLKEVLLGAERYQDVAFQVFDLSGLNAVTHLRLDGILGLPFFEGRLLVVDYPAKRLTTPRGTLPEPDGKNVLALKLGSDGIPTVAMRARDRELEFKVDTGSNGWVSVDAIAGEQLQRAGPILVSGFSASLGTTSMEWSMCLAEDLWLGAHRIPVPVVSVSPHSTIGSALLEDFRVTIDHDRWRMKLEGGAGPLETETSRNAGIGIVWEGDTAKISYVLPGHPSARQVVVGDVLVSVEGVPSEQLDVVELFTLAGDRSRLRVVVQRGSERRQVELPRLDLFQPQQVKEVHIRGARQLPAAIIEAVMATRKGETAYFNAPNEDAERVKDLYVEEGYLLANVEGPEWEVSDDGRQAEVTLTIDEGALFTIGKVTLAGALAKLPRPTFKAGEPFREERVRQALQPLVDHLKKRGGEAQRLAVKAVPNLETRRVDLDVEAVSEPPADARAGATAADADADLDDPTPPTTMTKMVVRSLDAANAHRQPLTLYRAGLRYGRSEMPTQEDSWSSTSRSCGPLISRTGPGGARRPRPHFSIPRASGSPRNAVAGSGRRQYRAGEEGGGGARVRQ
ncbi:MAG: aspartyl protease family protein [Myxococcales bacterium]